MFSPCIRAFASSIHRAIAPSRISILMQCVPSIESGSPSCTLTNIRGVGFGQINAPARTRTRNSSLEARHDRPFHHRARVHSQCPDQDSNPGLLVRTEA